jgi:hypothetical protein
MDVLAPAKRASGWMLKLAIERLALFAIALALGMRLFIQASQRCCRVGMVFGGFSLPEDVFRRARNPS